MIVKNEIISTFSINFIGQTLNQRNSIKRLDFHRTTATGTAFVATSGWAIISDVY